MKRNVSIALCLALALACALVFFPAGTPEPASGQGAGAQSDSDTQLLARCVNGEARGEPYIGQVAVAAVILNRVAHSSFPNSISGVIYQPGAFTAVNDGQINVPIDSGSQVYQACKEAMNGNDPTGGAIYYYNPEKTTNQWIYSREVIKTIGKHKFAKYKGAKPWESEINSTISRRGCPTGICTASFWC